MAYSIYSELSPYRDTGTLLVYAGTSAGKALEVVDLILAEFRSLKETPLTHEELTRAKDQLKGNILLGLESSNSRMANLARQEMYFHNFFTVDEVIARIDEVEAAQVQAMAQRLFDPSASLSPCSAAWMASSSAARGWCAENRRSGFAHGPDG